MKTQITVEEIVAIRKRRREINSLDLKDIEFTLNGEVIQATDEQIEEWKFTGLSNIDFVDCCLEGVHIPAQEK